ncbi:MAG: DUF2339 domain-containing protein [Chloroflexota bacterium]|nr:DUF2339 domain-containing protein [Chloroflexota bacterium]
MPQLDLEELAGRYGTIALASLAIHMGVGTFLSWAIEHGLLGPTSRVILGFIAAGIVAGVGVWVRDRHDARFGNVLLALALAIVHVDAWAAGPRLHVLSPVGALAIAAAASAALAALALTADARTLFVVGFAGALAAPFVTSSKPGNVILLLSYGWVVIATGIFAIRERGWRLILWLTVLGGIVYVAAAESVPHASGASWMNVHIPTLFAFACAAAALVWARETLRSKLALAFLLVAAFATLGYVGDLSVMQIALPLVGTIAAYAITRELETDRTWQVIGNVVIPLAFLATAIISSTGRTPAALAAVVQTVIAALMIWDADEEERPQHLFVTAVASGIAIVAYLIDSDTRCIGALALHAALFSVALRTSRAKLLAAPIFISLAISSVWTFYLLTARANYGYVPFGGIPSLCAIAVVIAWAIFAGVLRVEGHQPADPEVAPFEFVTILAISAAFMWVRQELVAAYSPDLATFLIIIYYALAGLALIFAGRQRTRGLWRFAGLALAFYAGYKALAESSSIDAIALRVGVRILVGFFLAAVAFWYRAPRDPAAGTTAATPTAAV